MEVGWVRIFTFVCLDVLPMGECTCQVTIGQLAEFKFSSSTMWILENETQFIGNVNLCLCTTDNVTFLHLFSTIYLYLESEKR